MEEEDDKLLLEVRIDKHGELHISGDAMNHFYRSSKWGCTNAIVSEYIKESINHEIVTQLREELDKMYEYIEKIKLAQLDTMVCDVIRYEVSSAMFKLRKEKREKKQLKKKRK